MACFQPLKVLRLSSIGVIFTVLVGFPVQAGQEAVGEKGANVYCFMRSTGNSHEVSWDAAYGIIKRQKSSLFKTSPKHAAVMITETVVQNPEKYNCGQYLGDLFAAPGETTLVSDPEKEVLTTETDEIPSEIKKGDRYSY